MSIYNPNEQLVIFLDYYITLPSPQYAVMLNAPWGAGKTWFINEFTKKIPDTSKYIYVTLNGLSSNSEIEEQFFEQLHPILSHKSVKFGASLLKGLLKGSLKIDLDGDGKEEGTANISVPDVNFKSILEKYENGCILIFDDVERCQIPIDQLLGYINYFVEHQNARVILLANENEIILKEGHENSEKTKNAGAKYESIREKLIGKTFTVHPEINNAIIEFISEIPNKDAVKTIDKERELIIETHAASGCNNLRHLRQAVLDLARIIQAIPSDKFKDEMLKEILRTFLIYQFEIRSGKIKSTDIEKINSLEFTSNSKNNLQQQLCKKYQITNLDSVFPNTLWANIFKNGNIDHVAILKAIDESRYFAKPDTRPDWICLHEAFGMDDEPLKQLIKKCIDSLQKTEYKSLGEIVHITGVLISLSSIGIVQKSSKEIVEAALANIKELKESKILPVSTEEETIFTDDAFFGRAFHSRGEPDFVNFLESASAINEEAKIASYPEKGKELLKLLHETKVDEFCSHLTHQNGKFGKYSLEPVLSYVDSAEFNKALAKMQSHQLRILGLALSNRYDKTIPKISSEIGWLILVEKILKPATIKTVTMSDFYRKQVHKTITVAISNLQKREPVNEKL